MGSKRKPLPLFEDFLFPSKHGIGDPVSVKVGDKEVDGWVRTVLFTNGKVRYSVKVPVFDDEGNEIGLTTVHNLDSVLVQEREGDPMEFTELDNYS